MTMTLNLGQIHSTIIKESQVAGFRLSESRYPAYLKTPKHCHQLACFCLVLSGVSQQTYGSKIRERLPNTMLFYPPGEAHSERFAGSGSRIFSIEMSSPWFERLREYTSVQNQSLGFEGGLLSLLSNRLYREFYNSDNVAPLAIEGLALEIFAEVCRRQNNGLPRQSPPWLRQAKDLIHAEFSTDLRLTKIANQVGVHPVYLASVFRQVVGHTVGEYVRKLRIEFAQKELLCSDTPLAQLAVAAGFANQAHFTRVFKQQTGITPGRYRSASHFS